MSMVLKFGKQKHLLFYIKSLLLQPIKIYSQTRKFPESQTIPKTKINPKRTPNKQNINTINKPGKFSSNKRTTMNKPKNTKRQQKNPMKKKEAAKSV